MTPLYRAGWVRADGSVRIGASITATHPSSGRYRISITGTPIGRQLVPVVSPTTTNTIARIVSYLQNPDGSHVIDVEIRNTSGALTDNEFTFIAMEGL